MDLEIIKIASNTENNNILKNYTFATKYKSAMCGDELKIYLKVHKEKINKLSYQSKSCVYCEASASLLSRYVRNKSINDIKKLINNMENYYEKSNLSLKKNISYFKKLFKEKNLSRKECLMLPFKTLKKIIQKNYE